MSERSSSAALQAFLERAKGSVAAEGARVISLADRSLRLGEIAAARAVAPARWQLDELVGRLTELSGIGAVASLSAVTSLVLEAQSRGEPAVWIGLPPATFFPPDLDDAGVDLDALVVVRAPDVTAVVRAADRLLRSSAFGLVILDLGPAWRSTSPGGGPEAAMVAAAMSTATQGRLAGLAQHHDAAIVVITEKPRDAASLGSMVSLRAEAMRERSLGGRGWRMTVRAVKDKRRGPGWNELADVIGPAGLV